MRVVAAYHNAGLCVTKKLAANVLVWSFTSIRRMSATSLVHLQLRTYYGAGANRRSGSTAVMSRRRHHGYKIIRGRDLSFPLPSA